MVVTQSSLALQSIISVLPVPAAHDLSVLQVVDADLSVFARFWRWGKCPDATERRYLSRSLMELVQQWDRIVEQDSILYCNRLFVIKCL